MSTKAKDGVKAMSRAGEQTAGKHRRPRSRRRRPSARQGPGVICPRATVLRNWVSVIQWYWSTASARMSGMITNPPP